VIAVAHFTPAEADACRRLVELALAEDLDGTGDRTSRATIPPELPGQALFVARAPGVLAGLPAVELVLAAVDPRLTWQPLLEDGRPLQRGDRIARVSGPMASILAAERTALNFLQRLSGVATQTRRYADQIAGLPCRLLDTRKTTPGWRLLEKYAVRMGGGHNHRMGLSDGVLIKDNHLAALGGGPGAITRAVRLARAANGPGFPVEVEVDTWDQFEEALAARPDIILLDNMPPELMRRCVVRRNEVTGPAVQLEASGGVTLQTLRAIAETGVDRVSVGALTHSAVALDIGLDYLTDMTS
jgi:nicotinate-nucleotide pyrophosphorylase (carboxylating)